MADPATMMLAAGGMQAVGQLQQGMAAASAGRYNARVAQHNAALTRMQGRRDEEIARRQSREVLGRMRAGTAARGIRMEGSTMDMLADSAYQAELDALNLRFQTETEARGFEEQARLSRMQGRAAQTGALMGAGTSLLMGGARAGMMD